MGLNIKNEHVHALARQVAEKTGETLTGAIRQALEHELERLAAAEAESRAERERKFKELNDFLDSLPPRPPGVTSDHRDMYDEDGLPI